jgi:regulator of replication initiation timing
LKTIGKYKRENEKYQSDLTSNLATLESMKARDAEREREKESLQIAVRDLEERLSLITVELQRAGKEDLIADIRKLENEKAVSYHGSMHVCTES